MDPLASPVDSEGCDNERQPHIFKESTQTVAAPLGSYQRQHRTCGSGDISNEAPFPPLFPVPGTRESQANARDRSRAPPSPPLVFRRSSCRSSRSRAEARSVADRVVLSAAETRREAPSSAAGPRSRRRFWVASPRPVFLVYGDALFNALLRCYALDRFPLEAFLLYKDVQSGSLSASSSVSFNSFTYTFLLNSCVGLGCTVPGVQLHGLTLKLGFESHVYVQTALVYMYVACGSVGDGGKVFECMPVRNPVTWNVLISGLTKWGRLDLARSLFEEMPVRTVVSWTAIIDGYTRTNRPHEAIHLFRKMVMDDGISPSEITMLTISPAIANIGSVKVCQSAHCYGEKRGFNSSDIRVANSLIDLYSKCGCIMSASKFFEEIMDSRKNLVSWTSVILAFAMHGMGEEAAQSLDRMEIRGLKPNQVTFLSILNAFSHGGLVEEGLRFFEKMVNVYQLVPDIKHYGSLVDMLGRAGRLKEAEKVALEVPREIANVVIWRTLLGACSFCGDVKMAEWATKRILEIERRYGGDYVLMSNVFAGAGSFNDAARLRQLMHQATASKVQGRSLV